MKPSHALTLTRESSEEKAETPEQRKARTGLLLSQISRDRRMRKTAPRPPKRSLAHCTGCGCRVLVDEYAINPIESCPACSSALGVKEAA